MKTPMPSPRGTNIAKLFLEHGPTAAYDAAPVSTETAMEVMEFLRGKIDAETIAEVAKLLGFDPDMAADTPKPFPGMPLPGGGKIALDAKTRSLIAARTSDARDRADREFAERYPHAASIKVER